MTACLIPARGGSKSIPHKNIVMVGGKPLLVWSIEQALAADEVSHVMVATDCQSIAEVAESAGAEVFWRSAATATDTATTESVISEVLHSMPSVLWTEYMVLLQATSPIRQPGDIDAAIRLAKTTRAASVFSARRVEGYTWRQPLMMEPQLINGPRQPRQLEQDNWWEENGSIYVFRTTAFVNCGVRICGRKAVYEMHPLDSYQIDETQDLELFEQLIPLRMAGATCR
jgi:N-acylneuraminate cytidylyltransferase